MIVYGEMCGIIGYVGKKNAVEVIIDGLTRLEYRGYDSAGICLKNQDGHLVQHKRAGKLNNLVDFLVQKKPDSHIGIGHTRWATHGRATDFNAHPHGNEKVNLVHNGIIENFQELREGLIKEGWNFKSETDSEVFFALIAKYLKGSLEDAVVSAFREIRGNSAFVVMEEGSDKIIAIKRATPLVCGKSLSGEDLFISSDPYALLGHANEVFFPEDDVICVFDTKSKERIRFKELDGSTSKRFEIQKIGSDFQLSDRGIYDHFMLKEIYEQPYLIRKFINFYVKGDGRKQLEKIKDLKPKQFHLCACGTAWHAGLCIKNIIEKKNAIPVNIDIASEFRYRNPLISKEDIGLFVSQSGETADTLAAQKLCQDSDIKTLSIVNAEGSTLFRESDYNLIIKAGTEVGVASTKAFTLMVLTGYLFSLQLKGEDMEDAVKEIERLADRIKEVIDMSDQIKKISKKIYEKKGFFYTGRGKYFPIALEGALKLKEIAYVHAEGYASGELKHGPIALIDEGMVNIALIGPELYEKTLSNIEEVYARGGTMVVIAPEGRRELTKIGHHLISLNFSGLENLSPLLVNVATQLLAYYIALYRGTDIDQPRNLAKSVTVE